MTRLIFNGWLTKWDKCIQWIHYSQNIKVEFCPQNTSIIQNCDQEIIRIVKAYYRQKIDSRILENMKDKQLMTANELAKKTSILDALHRLHFITMSCNNNMSPNALKYCFKKMEF